MLINHAELTGRILGCAYEVHAQLGPGLLESADRACLMHELAGIGLAAVAEVPVSLHYHGRTIETGYRADIIVEQKVLLELKATERLLQIHQAQALTYLRLSQLQIGLLINFNVVSLKNGIRRLAVPPLRTPLTP